MNKKMKMLHQQGFSLIEALVSALLLSVVILALSGLQTRMLSDSGENRITTHALNAASEKLEEMRDFSRQDLFDSLTAGNDTLNAANVQLSRSWTVTDNGGYITAQVQVVWVDSEGNNQNVQLTSYIDQADPVRSGKVLLAAVAGGGSTGGGSNGNTGDTGTDSNSDGGQDSSDSSGPDNSTGGDTGGSTGGGAGDSGSDNSTDEDDGSSGSVEVTGSASDCVTQVCEVPRKSTVSITFSITGTSKFDSDNVSVDGATLGTVTWSSASKNGTVNVTSPNGKNKYFSVTIEVDGDSVTLQFVTI